MKNENNKAMKLGENKKISSLDEGKNQTFFYPDFGISVEAKNKEEADKIVLAKKKKKE